MPLGVLGTATQVRLDRSEALEEPRGAYGPAAFRVVARDWTSYRFMRDYPRQASSRFSTPARPVHGKL